MKAAPTSLCLPHQQRTADPEGGWTSPSLSPSPCQERTKWGSLTSPSFYPAPFQEVTCRLHLPPHISRVSPTPGQVWFGRHEHVPTRFPFLGSSMEELRHQHSEARSMAGPSFRAGRMLLQPSTDVEEFQGWGSERGGSLGLASLSRCWDCLGRAETVEACRCLFPTTDLAWCQSHNCCFACTPSACLPVYAQAASLTAWLI